MISGNDILTNLLLTLILIFCPYFWNPASDYNILFSILGSQMSPHVMYGSARLSALSYLSLSSSIVSCICLSIIYIECTTIHNAHLWVPLQERNNMTNRYKVFTFIITIIFYLYNTINIIHKCTLNCKDFLIGSSSSNLIWYSSSPVFSYSHPN